MLVPALWELWLRAPELSRFQPGQFWLTATPSYVRRSLFPARCPPEGAYASADPAIAWVVSRAVGEAFDLVGPFGRGFAAPRRAEHWLLVAETAADVGPLQQQMELAAAADAEIVLLTGAVHAMAVFPAAELSLSVELRRRPSGRSAPAPGRPTTAPG